MNEYTLKRITEREVESTMGWAIREMTRYAKLLTAEAQLRVIVETICSLDRLADSSGDSAVNGVSCLPSYDENESARVNVDLSKDAAPEAGQQFVRDLMSKLGVSRAEKKNDGGDSLTCTFHVGNISVKVEGYMGPTCRVVKESVLIPEHYETKRRVVCSDEDERESGYTEDEIKYTEGE